MDQKQKTMEVEKPTKNLFLEKLEHLNKLISTQERYLKNEESQYEIGLYNGMILARSVFMNERPQFYKEEEQSE